MTRVAIVEDNADNRLLMRVLVGRRYELTEYGSGEEALAEFEHAAPDLVLLDISLPGIDGVEVLTRLRAREATARLPVIALSAHAEPGERERLVAVGFDDYVAKPIVDDAVLGRAIEDALARARG